jgi:uncharacterized repeat protein (TIGR04076 family)
MHELWIEVERVEGVCTGPVQMVPGTAFRVRNGSLIFPGGGPICLFALQSILPMIPAKERLADGDPTAGWMGRVEHVQCPDPKGRAIWRIEQRTFGSTDVAAGAETYEIPSPALDDLVVTVERIEGRCLEGMCVGRTALLRDSSLYLPQPFCLYALQAALPMLPAMQRKLDPGDWMATENEVVCPDPLGSVVLRIEKVGSD